MRFSSNVVPETRIANPEESDRTIMFAEATPSNRPERPPFSRTNSRQSRVSMVEFAARKRPETPLKPSVSFIEPHRDQLSQKGQQPHRPHFSRHSSTPVAQRVSSFDEREQGGEGDVHLGMPDVEADYKARRRESRESNNQGGADGEDDNNDGSGSSYATQDLSLSFNDLPSRAQHLILNELMRRHSGSADENSSGAAVLFTRLPIPDEGTYRDEKASIQYLSDVELLCQNLPPVLMILSNNMTVTVSL